MVGRIAEPRLTRTERQILVSEERPLGERRDEILTQEEPLTPEQEKEMKLFEERQTYEKALTSDIKSRQERIDDLKQQLTRLEQNYSSITEKEQREQKRDYITTKRSIREGMDIARKEKVIFEKVKSRLQEGYTLGSVKEYGEHKFQQKFYVPDPKPKVKTPITKQPTTAWKNILTGEMMSARTQPSSLHKKVVVDVQGRELPQGEQISLSLKKPERVVEKITAPTKEITQFKRTYFPEIDTRKSLISRVGSDFERWWRTAFNIRRKEDLTAKREGVFVRKGAKDIPIQIIPTGTIIDEGSLVKQELTIGQLEEQKVFTTDVLTPTAFLVGDIKDKVVSEFQNKLNVEQGKIQGEVYSGRITQQEADKMIDVRTKVLQNQAQQQFGKEVETSPRISKQQRDTAEYRKLKSVGKVDVTNLVSLGWRVGAIAGAGVTGGVSLIPMMQVGALEIFTAPTKETKTEKLLTIGGGLIDVSIGASAFTKVAVDIDRLALKELAEADTRFLGKEVIQTDVGSLIKTKLIKKTEFGEVVMKSDLPIFRTGEKTFSLTGATGKVETRFFSFRTGQVETGETLLGLQARGQVTETGAQFIKKFEEGIVSKAIPEELVKVTGTGQIIRGKKYLEGIDVHEAFLFRGAPLTRRKVIFRVAGEKPSITGIKFGAIAKETDDFIAVVGGDVNKIIKSIVTTRQKVQFKPSVYGLVERFKPPKEAVKIIKPAKIVKTPLSKTFQADLKQQVSQMAKSNQKLITGATASVSPLTETAMKQQVKQVSQMVKTETRTALAPVITKEAVRIRLQEGIKTEQLEKTILKDLQKTSSKTIQKIEQESITKLDTALKTSTALQPKFALKLAQELETKLGLKTLFPSFPITQPPITRAKLTGEGFKPFIPLPFFLFGKPKTPKKDRGAYNVLGKRLKQNKFMKLNIVPLTRERAKDVGAYLSDTSLSRTFKIRKTKGKPKPSRLDVPLGYFNAVKYKLRDYKIRKGKQIPMDDKWIERSSFALDTIPEVQQIDLFKRLSQVKKKKKIKKKILKQKLITFEMKSQPLNMNKILRGILT